MSLWSVPLPLQLFVCLLATQVGSSLRMVNLDAPQIALQGNTIQLSCLFKLSSSSYKQQAIGQHQLRTTEGSDSGGKFHLAGGGAEKLDQQESASKNDEQQGAANELLYAIKWYKDGKEFYRYLAQDWPRKQSLPVDGIQLDVDKSDNQTIVLRSVTLRTSGLYKCEVSTDAPQFITKFVERRLFVYVLPNKGPVIEMIKPAQASGRQLFRGDSVELVCSSSESKPPLSLDWIINDTLNLSSALSGGGGGSGDINSADRLDQAGRFFNFSSSRLVRLPNLQASSVSPPISAHATSSMAQPIGSKRPSHMMPSQIFYLIQNGSVASPLLAPTTTASELPGKPQPAINLTGSLDRLAETSTTRLNFTVDANLFLYLSNRLAASQRSPLPQVAASAILRSRGTRQTSNRLDSPHEATNRTNRMSRSKFKDLPRRPSNQSTTSTMNSNNNVVRRKSSPTNRVRPFDATTLRIKCVARVMHLTMSDEVKFNLVVDKSRDEAAETSAIQGVSSERVAKSG